MEDNYGMDMLALLCGVVGLLVISRAVWLRNERAQDEWFIVGGILLLVYSVSIGSAIFTILQLVFILSAFWELKKLRK
ncbi:MAG: hypothetical protein NUV53_00335 [Patescibacteria group bacterium]|nr:hypothetical protein [Patescibacteria group bacterium]